MLAERVLGLLVLQRHPFKCRCSTSAAQRGGSVGGPQSTRLPAPFQPAHVDQTPDVRGPASIGHDGGAGRRRLRSGASRTSPCNSAAAREVWGRACRPRLSQTGDALGTPARHHPRPRRGDRQGLGQAVRQGGQRHRRLARAPRQHRPRRHQRHRPARRRCRRDMGAGQGRRPDDRPHRRRVDLAVPAHPLRSAGPSVHRTADREGRAEQ
jgi:hypothetical protein